MYPLEQKTEAHAECFLILSSEFGHSGILIQRLDTAESKPSTPLMPWVSLLQPPTAAFLYAFPNCKTKMTSSLASHTRGF